jgi:hypothetical protein
MEYMSQNKTRCFAFGCSYTQYAYATWADYLGANFDEYYNYSRAGASNTFVMNRLVEANSVFQFDPATDYVVVMLTGFGRFSYLLTDHNNNSTWVTEGDLYSYYAHTKDAAAGWLLKNIWNEKWAVYMSWVATKAIKDILASKKIPHKILMGIDNSHYMEETATKWGHTHVLQQETIDKVKEIYEIIDVSESYDQWMMPRYTTKDYPVWKDYGKSRIDGHPSQRIHYEYFKEIFPEYATDKSLNVFNLVESIFRDESQDIQGNSYIDNFYKDFNKAMQFPLFGGN